MNYNFGDLADARRQMQTGARARTADGRMDGWADKQGATGERESTDRLQAGRCAAAAAASRCGHVDSTGSGLVRRRKAD